MSRASDDELAALRVRVAELEEELRAALAANAVLTKKVSIRPSLFSLFCAMTALTASCTHRPRTWKRPLRTSWASLATKGQRPPMELLPQQGRRARESVPLAHARQIGNSVSDCVRVCGHAYICTRAHTTHTCTNPRKNRNEPHAFASVGLH